MVVRQGLLITITGIVVGLIAALLLTRVVSSMLYQVSAYDFMAFILMPAVLLCVASLACYLPARRATKVDPIEALRES